MYQPAYQLVETLIKPVYPHIVVNIISLLKSLLEYIRDR